MELLTGFVAESTTSLLNATISRIAEEMKLAWGFKADLRDLEGQLRRLDAILCGSVQARSGAGNNDVLNEWLKEIGKVAYQAEDIMDEYSYELLKRKIALRNRCQRLRRFKTKARLFFSLSSNPVVFRFKMAHGVKSMKESIDNIYDKAKKHGISPVEVGGGQSYVYNYSDDHDVTAVSLQRQMPYNEVLIQRKDAEDDVVRWLREASHSDKHLNVVGIWGMAGLGKTTLCDSIFKTMEIDGEFEERIWICVSHDFEFIQLLNRVIEKMEKHPSNISDLHTLGAKLIDIMKGRKFLLVLDDIWDTFEKYWGTLRSCLKDVGASKGNTILATSRLESTLKKSDAFHILPLEKLSVEDSRSLFKQCVGENNLSDPAKAELGWKMLRKCDGVPLAIKALGGMLKSQTSTSQWRKIEEDHDIWNKVDDIILPSVKLSFKCLPSAALKKCFAYCAIFKEDEVIKKDRLIQLWMAQGFLQPYDHDKEELRDELLGEKFLHILLNGSLFQEAKFDDLGNVRTCKMHDTVRNLALDISKADTEIIERRSILNEGRPLEPSDGSIASLGITRLEFIERAKCLRVLSLVRVGLGEGELGYLFGELKHLRYLEISENEIECLPPSLGKLYHLQTLRIFSYRWNRRMPNFPEEFTKLANLRHLCSNLTMEIPVGLGMLTSLQTLPAIDLDEHSWGGRASELGNLHNLKGELRLKGFKDAEITEELKQMKLGTKEKVEKLVLEFCSHFSEDEEDVNHVMMLEALAPHPNLAALEIEGYQSKALPNWMMEMTGYEGTPLRNLVSFIVRSSNFTKQMPSMKNLSALKVLKIWNCSATSLQNLECLTSLQHLALVSCPEMENLPNARSLSSLEVLRIEYCRSMTCLPSGLSNLRKLETLVITAFNPDVSIFPFPDLKHQSPLATSLRELRIDAYGMDKVVSLPSQMQHLNQLRVLGIWNFKNVRLLPEWLGNLTSLVRLGIGNLPLVEHLPSQAAMERLSQLTELLINGCPLLQKSCRTPGGSEWEKIKKNRHVGTLF